MKKIVKILAIMAIIGILFFVGVEINNYSESYGGLVFSGVQDVSADGPCIPPPPGYPNNCDP